MTVTIDEDPADPSVHEPRVTGSPEAIWLVYGELEHDDTHANCCTESEVTWCEDAQFAADVRYTRTDRVGELVRAAAVAERERWIKGHDRYEVARLMTPGQWAYACRLNVTTGKPFDQIIDELAPFYGKTVRAA